MVKIVDDLLYNTETSEIIYKDYDNKRLYYKAEHGHFFAVSNNGELWAVNEETIKRILGANDVEKYIELFGEPEEA